MKKGFKILFLILAFVLSFSFCQLIIAASDPSDRSEQTEAFAGPQGAGFVGDHEQPQDPRVVAGFIIRVALSMLGIGFLCYLIYGGVLFLFSQGNEEKTGKGKKTIFTAVIGVIIILLAYALTNYIISAASGSQLNEGQGFHIEPDISMPRDVLDRGNSQPTTRQWGFQSGDEGE